MISVDGLVLIINQRTVDSMATAFPRESYPNYICYHDMRVSLSQIPFRFLVSTPIIRLTGWPISATLFKFPRIAVRVFSLSLELRRSPDLPSSNTQGALAFCGWFLYVGLHHWHFAVTMCHIAHFRTSSWEFLITLDYEWNIIRGRRRYRWTIWVCIDSFFVLRHSSGQQSDLLVR